MEAIVIAFLCPLLSLISPTKLQPETQLLAVQSNRETKVLGFWQKGHERSPRGLKEIGEIRVEGMHLI